MARQVPRSGVYTLRGTVTDATGAIFPGATVTATNVEIGVVRTTQTNESGVFFIPELIVGRYTIAAELSGFKVANRTGVSLRVADEFSFDFSLQPGDVNEVITVEASATPVRLVAARRRQVDVVGCWRLDRLGRSLRHLLDVLQEFEALGVSFISLNEGLDMTTPSGKLQFHLLAAFAEFERARIQERVRAGLARARRQGKRLGRPPRRITSRELQLTHGLSLRVAARELGVSSTHVHRPRRASAERSGQSNDSDPAECV